VIAPAGLDPEAALMSLAAEMYPPAVQADPRVALDRSLRAANSKRRRAPNRWLQSEIMSRVARNCSPRRPARRLT